jgi:membrane protein YdbS with pleckstrin-like domain
MVKIKRPFGPINILMLQCSVFLLVLFCFNTVFKQIVSLIRYRIYISSIIGLVAVFGVGYLLNLEPKRNAIQSVGITIVIALITIAASWLGVPV